MNIIWILLTFFCSLCAITYCEKKDYILLPSDSPMVTLPFETAKQEIIDDLQKFDNRKHNIKELKDLVKFYVYSRRIYTKFMVDNMGRLGNQCAVCIAPEEGNHYYEVKYLSCGGKVIIDIMICQ